MLRDLSKLVQNTSRDGTSGHQSVISPPNAAAAFPKQGTPNPNKCTEVLHLAEQGHSGSPQDTPGMCFSCHGLWVFHCPAAPTPSPQAEAENVCQKNKFIKMPAKADEPPYSSWERAEPHGNPGWFCCLVTLS